MTCEGVGKCVNMCKCISTYGYMCKHDYIV